MSQKSDQFKNVGQLTRGKSKYSVRVLVQPEGAESQKTTMVCITDFWDDFGIVRYLDALKQK